MIRDPEDMDGAHPSIQKSALVWGSEGATSVAQAIYKFGLATGITDS
jgi:hypothetical protein